MPRQVRAVPVNVLDRICKLMMWSERLSKLMDARTIFIPKKSHEDGPAYFRPITISTAPTVIFYSILAKRMDSAVEFSEEQRAFKAGIDGCGGNTVFLDSILRCNELYSLLH